MVRLHRPTLSWPTVPLVADSHGNDRPPNRAASLSFSHPLVASPSATYIRTHPIFPSLSLSLQRVEFLIFFLSHVTSVFHCRSIQRTNILCLSQGFSLIFSLALSFPASRNIYSERAIFRKWILLRNQPHYRFTCLPLGSVIAQITEPFYTQHSHIFVLPYYIPLISPAVSCYVHRLSTRKATVFFSKELACHAFHPLFPPRLHSLSLPPFVCGPFLLFAASGARLTSLPFEKEKEQRGILDTT